MYRCSKGSCCQVHRPSVRAARLSDPLTRVWGALCPRAWGSRPGNRAGGVLDRGGSERGGGPLVFSGSGRSQGGAGGENSKSKSEIWRNNWLKKLSSIECWGTKIKYSNILCPHHLELTCNICVILEQNPRRRKYVSSRVYRQKTSLKTDARFVYCLSAKLIPTLSTHDNDCCLSSTRLGFRNTKRRFVKLHLEKNNLKCHSISETISFSIGCSMSNAVSAKLEREPVEDLSNWDEADSETKSTEAAKSRNEIHPSHLFRPLKLWRKFNS